MDHKKCLVQVDEVLSHLREEDFKKIPLDVRNSIKENKDKTYTWKYDETKDICDQDLDRKSVAILSYLNMEYLVNKEQKEFLKELHRYNERKKYSK